MKAIIDGVQKDVRAVWMEAPHIKFIDQRLLPQKFEIFTSRGLEDTAFAIKDMVVRGAPAIGAAAAYGMAQASLMGEDVQKAAEVLKSTRPTAYDLFYAVDRMLKELESGKDAVESSEAYVGDIVSRCRRIGENGESLIKDGFSILTHCNAGALATVDYGTALAPMRMAHYGGKKIFVFADETRPRLQGAKLTAWELLQEGIPHAVIADNAAGYYMRAGKIDIVITGADRIAANGDAANKIGTYTKAVLAKENGIPFYVAAPVSTFDPSIELGDDIIIEERSEEEVTRINDVPITPEGSHARNPSFDVTLAKYITGIITEKGIFKPEEVGKGFG